MATGAIFQLITNDGKQDRILNATAFLNKRLAEITQARRLSDKSGEAVATLADIEKTHILFMNAHFKPFCATGYEYNKVQTSAGNAQLGSEVQFSIPQFGDFFADMILHVVIAAPAWQPVDTTSNLAADDSDEHPLMRWCDFPGERLARQVKFEVNGNPLDDYSPDALNFYRQYVLPANKRLGWYRCMGQETPVNGWVQQPVWSGNGFNKSAVGSRMKCSFDEGPQTPSGTKGSLELFIPLMFWFNKDIRLAIPSVSIPYGMRFITINLAQQTELIGEVPRGQYTFANPGRRLDTTRNLVEKCELYINNLFVLPEIHNIFIKRVGFNLIRVHRKQVYNAVKTTDEVLLNQLKWPVESLFIGMRVKEYNDSNDVSRRQHLDKWHLFSKVDEDNSVQKVDGWNTGRTRTVPLATPLVAGTLVAAFGTRGLGAVPFGGNDIQPGDVLTVTSHAWMGPAASYDFEVKTSGTTGSMVLTGGLSLANAIVSGAVLVVTKVRRSDFSGSMETKVARFRKTLNSISIKAHGITIYNEFPSTFYNAYIPYQFGGQNINVPEDIGAHMISFALYPGSYQPSGHINLSRAREFYISYVSDTVSANSEGTLIVLASAINFLLITDGSAILRYST